ncbi:MAG: 6-phosphofructokinase [Mycoplasmatales bacterium]
MIKKIAILTSGGDAPGMNAAIRSTTRTAISNGIEVYGIEDGYYGLYHNKIFKLESRDVANQIYRGGTFLGSARFPDFKDLETREKAVKNLDVLGIEALVVIGGDGSYMGALKLTEMGYPTIGLPGTIDNDISSTEFTIGFDTALNTIVENVDKLRDTSGSHRRCSVVEVMGRDAGDLALWAGIATGAEATLIPEVEPKIDEITNKIKNDQKNGKRHFIVIVAEGLKISEKLTQHLEKETGISTRLTILGHIQRGGSPTAFDRVLASRMGEFAIEQLMAGNKGECIGIKENKLVSASIKDSLEQKHSIDEKMFIAANRYLNI